MPEAKNSSFIFNVINDSSIAHYVQVKAIGYEMQKHDAKKEYYWDCRNSEMHDVGNTSCILQYTVSGEGMLEIDDKVTRIRAGSFFLIERPGEYRYWLPEDSNHWEIKFMDFSAAALPIWESITEAFGRVFSVNNSNEVMTLWDEFYQKCRNNQITNIFDNSCYAYQFLLTLHRYLTTYGTKSPQYEAVQKSLQFMDEHFADNLTLSEIAEASGLSTIYLNRVFKTMIGDTPVRHLVKTRVRYGMQLLHNTDLSIDTIAEQCGFQNANYFAKVFRKYLNVSPTDFRKQEMSPIIL